MSNRARSDAWAICVAAVGVALLVVMIAVVFNATHHRV